jgi:hypothetical protein
MSVYTLAEQKHREALMSEIKDLLNEIEEVYDNHTVGDNEEE